MTSLTIGQLCEQTGEESHVLRHWEDVGLLRPTRTPAGHRRYHPATVAGVLTVRRLQRVGFSLADIVALHRGAKPDRTARFDAHRSRLVADRAAIDAALGYIEHTMDCVHPVVDDCPSCAAFAAGGG
ncbi:MAG: MerR family transcriptional regulator [Acidimicrobiia bacterium]|nr:MerR family transcriptional regulator [Acidimicrobiia bacterium]